MGHQRPASRQRSLSPTACPWVRVGGVAGALCILLAAGPAAAEPELLDRVVAVVDDQVILWSELNYRLGLDLEQQRQRAPLSAQQLDRRRSQTLDQMIDEQVLLLKARQDSVVVDESQVEEIVSQHLQQVKGGMAPEEYNSMLGRSGLTERQLKARFRKDIRHNLLYDQMRSQLAMRLRVTPKDLAAYRQAYRDSLPPRIAISQILAKFKPSDEVLAAARAKIAQVQRELDAGGDFAELARRYSEDPGTAANGGDVGCFAPGQVAPEFEAAAGQLKPDQISPPVLTAYGYHLIRLREQRESELCASHILVRAVATRQDRERAMVRLEELRQRVLAGADFAQLARESSEDPPSARRGGLWQIVNREGVPPVLAPHLQGLGLGQVSAPFSSDDGGHLLRIDDDPATLEGLVREERMNELMRRLIDDFKTQIHVGNRLDLPLFGQAGERGAPASDRLQGAGLP